MKALKKLLLSTTLALTMFTTIPAPKANAGLLLAPVGVGIFILVYGAIKGNWRLILLDADTTVSDQIQYDLSQKFPFIDDNQALKDLSELIIQKAEGDFSVKKEISISRKEVLDILEPTGLAMVEPEKVEKLIKELE